MAPLQPLTQLLEHERRARDDALLALRNAEAAVAAAEEQALQLDRYRGEYVERWSARFREPSSVTLVQSYQSFMQRLDQAIAQQRQAVQSARARVERERQALVEQERRVAAMEKLIARRQQQEQRELARREQTRSDESAQRAHARRTATEPPDSDITHL